MINFKLKKLLGNFKGAPILDLKDEVMSGCIIQVDGISGSGKTTFLKILAGFIRPEVGFISVDGVVWLNTKSRFSLPANKRNAGFVFQDYALFPHLSVRQHLEYAGNNQDLNEELIEKFGLSDKAHSLPGQLSGGQQQRLAIIRALAAEPQILLMDEPFSALDRGIKIEICKYLASYLERNPITCFIASHQPLETESEGFLRANQMIRI